MMNDEQTYLIGDYQTTPRENTTAVAPTIRRVRTMDAKSQRCQRSQERQTKIGTDSDVTNGFLKTSFLPKLNQTNAVQACEKTVERDFYKSLSLLAQHYNIEMIQSQDYDYPYNMVLAMWDAQTKLKQSNTYWDNLCLVQASEKTFLTSEERYRTGSTLYYIPIVPLFQMLHDPKRKKTAQLLVCVFSYLYHVVAIPYYTQVNSYLYWLYEMMNDWVEQDYETVHTQQYKNELRQAEQIGEQIERKLFNRINLQVFETRLNRFKSRDMFDDACNAIACNAFALYTQYPTTSIFRNASSTEEDPCNDESDSGIITMEKYISFVADTKGWLYERLADCINNEFNEYGEMDEPTICKRFDGGNITQTNLDFENRLFVLLEELCTMLNYYQTTRK